MKYLHKTKKLIITLTLLAVIAIGTGAPITPTGIQKSHAQILETMSAVGGLMGIDLDAGGVIGGVLGDVLGIGGDSAQAVQIVEDLSPSSIARTAANISQTLSLTKQEIKEEVLDPLFWKLGNATIGDMVGSMVEWVNNTGDGNPAFIQDFEQHFEDVEDLAATEYLENPGFDAMCESIAVDVKASLEKKHALGRDTDNAAIARNECSINKYSDDEEAFREGDFTQGEWAAWFELPENDPVNVHYKEAEKMARYKQRAYEIEKTKAIAYKGFKSVEECESYDSVSKLGRNCKIKTPGSVVQDQLVNSLNLPGLRVAFAGELDESLGAMMSSLFSQAFLGTNGLLGLGGNDSYTDSSYGSEGNLSFLEGLRQEASDSIAGTQTAEKIQQLIQTQFDYSETLLEIIKLIDRVDAEILDAEKDYGACFTTELTPKLTSARKTANTRALQAGERVKQLIGYYEQLQAATTDAERAQVVIAVGTYETQVGSQFETATQSATRDLEQILPHLIDNLQKEIEGNIVSCGGEMPDSNDTTASSTANGTDEAMNSTENETGA